MKPTVYIETSVISYLAARPSRDLVVAGHQQITHTWWSKVLPLCSPVISPLVLGEAGRGDVSQARARLALTDGFPLLRVDDRVERLAAAYFRALCLTDKVRTDALHLALATVHGIDYLLSWNCTHIVSARVRIQVSMINQRLSLISPTICTPEELMEV